MAKYWKLKYHDDITEKHKLNQEEIQFLKELQKEMNTQDNAGQADPRYWTIRNYKRIYGDSLNNPEGISIYDADDHTEIIDVEYRMFCSSEMADDVIKALLENDYALSFEDIELIQNTWNLESLVEALNELNFTVVEYEEYPSDEGVFLTHKAAQEHLKANSHHYSENAHTYALTAWRSNERMLWDILRKVDLQ